MRRMVRKVGVLAVLAMLAASPAFAGGGSIDTFTGSELSGVSAVVGGFLGIGILVFVGIKVFKLGKRGGNAA